MKGNSIIPFIYKKSGCDVLEIPGGYQIMCGAIVLIKKNVVLLLFYRHALVASTNQIQFYVLGDVAISF